MPQKEISTTQPKDDRKDPKLIANLAERQETDELHLPENVYRYEKALRMCSGDQLTEDR